MSDDRRQPSVREGGLLLAALLLTPDEGLPSFRDRRVRARDVELDKLAQARAALDAISYVLRSPRRDDWNALEQAWSALRRVAPPPETKPAEREPAIIPSALDAPPRAATTKAAPPTPATPDDVAAAPAPPAVVPSGIPPAPPPPRAPRPGSAVEAPRLVAAPARPPSVWIRSSEASNIAAPAREPLVDEPTEVGEATLSAEPTTLAGPGVVQPVAEASGPEPRLGETVGLSDVLSPFVTGALPFRAPSSSQASSELAAPRALADEQDEHDALGQTRGIEDHGTLGLTHSAVAISPLSVLPFREPPGPEDTLPEVAEASPGVPELTLEQYASLLAEQGLGIDQATLWRRYHIRDAAAAASLHARWSRRFGRDAALGKRCEQLVAHYRQWIERWPR